MKRYRKWETPERIVQYNLQVADTPLMDAKKIAKQSENMHATSVMINMAGDYAWYPTKVPFHTQNEFLPEGKDLLKDLIQEHHQRNIKIIGRLSCGMVTDQVYHQNPSWVMRDIERKPVLMGEERPGPWSLMYGFCINSSYVDEVIIPALEECLKKYGIDAIFLCGLFAAPCWCDNCRRLYHNKYGKELPEDPKLFEPGWLDFCQKRRLKQIEQVIEKGNPDIPFIHYYHPFAVDMGNTMDMAIEMDDVETIREMKGLQLEEAQDIISVGRSKLQSHLLPTIRMKMCQNNGSGNQTIGLIHSAPGLDWRHIDIPETEYCFWCAQVIASGAQIGYSLTGFPDAMYDKRILKSIIKLNKMAEKTAPVIMQAKRYANVLIVCNAEKPATGWATALAESHKEYDLVQESLLEQQKLESYQLIIIPYDVTVNSQMAKRLEVYVAQGGNLFVEGTNNEKLEPIKDLLGIEGIIVESEELEATYLRIQSEMGFLEEEIKDTELLPLKGRVGFYKENPDVKKLLTWVPTFAPTKFIAFPPDRASLCTKRTEVPMLTTREYGKGRSTYFSFHVSDLVVDYGLKDISDLLKSCFNKALNEEIRIKAPSQIISYTYKTNSGFAVFFINGIGSRPLKEVIPCTGIVLQFRKSEKKKIKSVYLVMEDEPIPWKENGEFVEILMPVLMDWSMIQIELTELL